MRSWIENPQNKQKYEKLKYITPLCTYIFDDFSQNFQQYKEISNLFSKNRHFKAIVFLSVQKYKSIQRIARENLQYIILTRGLSHKCLKEILEE